MNFKLIIMVALVATAMARDIRLNERAPGINNLFIPLSEVLRWKTFPHYCLNSKFRFS
jgi:hypothetical protein